MTTSTTEFIRETDRQSYRPAAVRQIENERRADTETDAYAAFIWDLATKITGSTEEARAAVKEMYADIQRCSEGEMCPEDRLIAGIAMRRLLKCLD